MADILFKNVEVIYLGRKKQEFTGLKDLSCHFEDGKISVIIGYSGSGKSTVLRALAGQVHYGGSILYDGNEIDEMEQKDKNMSLVQQNYSLFPRMTIYDNLAFPLKIQNYSEDEIDKRVKETAEFLGILHCLTRKPKELSGGQQQKVCIGRAIIKKPDTILFDEPLANVDPQNRIEIMKYIMNLSRVYGITCIYVTHNITEALTLGNKIYILNEGTLVSECSPDELMKSDNPIVKSLLVEQKDNG